MIKLTLVLEDTRIYLNAECIVAFLDTGDDSFTSIRMKDGTVYEVTERPFDINWAIENDE